MIPLLFPFRRSVAKRGKYESKNQFLGCSIFGFLRRGIAVQAQDLGPGLTKVKDGLQIVEEVTNHLG